MAQDPRKHFENRRQALKQERKPWDRRAEEISRYQFPELGRFSDKSRSDAGLSKRENIINNILSQNAIVLRAGMLAGITSPTRPWVRVTTVDTELAKFQPVRRWLDFVSERMMQQFAISNTYKALGGVYMESALFSANAMYMQEDVQDEFRFYSTTWGEFLFGASERGDVDTCYREFPMTVYALVKRFGEKAVSSHVKNLWDKGQYDTWVNVVHALEPHNEDLEGVEFKLKRYPYRSVYYERGEGKNRFLEVKGYKRKPFFGPRWATVTCSDVYGAYCPGIIALGDAIELQHHELVKAQAQEMMTQPPILAPSSNRQNPINIGPAAVTRYDLNDGQASIRPLFDVRFDVEHSRLSIEDIADRARLAFHVDLFRTVMDVRSRSVNTPITAREIDQLEKEGLLQLGPVLEAFDDELLDPLIESTFQLQLENGDYPPPPEDLLGAPLRVEYISTIHQAQKLVALQPFDRVHQFAGALVGVTQDKGILDVIDADQALRDYAQLAGYPPALIRDPKEVDQMRQSREQQAKAMQAAQMAQSAAGTAKTLSETDTGGGENALSRLTQALRARQ